MIAVHNDKLYELIRHYKDDIQAHLVIVKAGLEEHINKPTYGSSKDLVVIPLSKEETAYIKYLKENLDDIVIANNAQLETYRNEFDKIISPDYRNDDVNNFKRFKDKLVEILNYSKLRSDRKHSLYPKLFEKLGIKSCVYCNSQLTVVVDDSDGIKSAKLEVDHFQAKADYPCFSISFFNLYPVCSSCNGKKGRKELNFHLYSTVPDELNTSKFYFEIDRASLARYRLNGIESELQIRFLGDGSNQFNEIFAVQGIYNTQKDLAAEIVYKSILYNDSYKASLKSAFKKLYSGKSIFFNTIILGNYTNIKEIHKRPMAKFTQDIGRQLGLI